MNSIQLTRSILSGFFFKRLLKLFLLLAFLFFLDSHTRVRSEVNFSLQEDSYQQKNVPTGKIEHYQFANSKIFPGTVRDYWIYIPQQYRPESPACLMVFQDGKNYVKRDGQWKIPNVFDNLIHKKEMPVTLGIFINPGVVPAPHTNAQPRFNRSYEYDSLGDEYARFLLNELIPEVEKKYSLSSNPNDRAICGSSSGGIAAFTVAWERPDAFSRVFTTVGTYVGLRGGNEYPTLIRKTEPKPIRVFLQDGSKDLNIYGGNWWIANQAMLNALQFSGYDVKHAWGEGGHNGRHGASIFPQVMKWLWRDYPAQIKTQIGEGHKLSSILIQGENWEVVSSGHKFSEGPVAGPDGSVYFSDIPNNKIFKIAKDGKVSTFASNTGRANGLTIGADGLIYACSAGKKTIDAYDPISGRSSEVIRGYSSNDLVALPFGGYFTSPTARKIYFVNDQFEVREVDSGIRRPNGIVTSPDHTLLYVSDSIGRFVYSFQIQPDGSLSHKQKFFHLHLEDNQVESGADGMTTDSLGRLYVATNAGIQIFDQPGRVNAIIPKPQRAKLSNLTFGGPNLEYLYVTCGDKVYRRKTQVNGLVSSAAPIKPPRPRL